MASPAVTLCSFAILLAALQAVAVSQVHAKPEVASVAVSAAAGLATHKKVALHDAQSSIMKSAPQDLDEEDIDHSDDPNVHGEPGHKWKWMQSSQDSRWHRKSLTDDEALEADSATMTASNADAARAASHTAAAAHTHGDSPPSSDGGSDPEEAVDKALKALEAAVKAASEAHARKAGGAAASGGDHTITDQPVAEEVAAKGCSSGETTVAIEVYYETRCPGCMEFINKTLETLWRNAGMKKTLNISMIAFGNSQLVATENISDGYKSFHKDTTGAGFDYVQVCQHGPEECFGNLVDVCAKHVAHTAAALLEDLEEKEKEHDKYMNLVFCMSGKTVAGFGAENAAYECLEETGIDKHKVKDCVQGTQGNKLIAEAGKRTLALKEKKGTPWVVVNGAHAGTELLQNGTLLTKAVCSHVCNAPEPCTPFVGSEEDIVPAATPEREEPDFQVLTEHDFIRLNREHI